MVSGRPLLYLSLPGVAIIFGVFWYRRRYRNQSDSRNAKKQSGSINEELRSDGEARKGEQIHVERDKLTASSTTSLTLGLGTTVEAKSPNNINELIASKAVNISGTKAANSIEIKGSGSAIYSSDTTDENAVNRIFGKSAPITIVQNGKSYASGFGAGSMKQNHYHHHHYHHYQQQHKSQHKQQVQVKYFTSQQQLNCEELKSKIQNVEQKLLCSIDEDHENLSSSVELPDSLMTSNKCAFFYKNRTADYQNSDKTAIVVKASNTPKVSPKNSFPECKYVKEKVDEEHDCDLVDGRPQRKQQEHLNDPPAMTDNQSDDNEEAGDCDKGNLPSGQQKQESEEQKESQVTAQNQSKSAAELIVLNKEEQDGKYDGSDKEAASETKHHNKEMNMKKEAYNDVQVTNILNEVDNLHHEGGELDEVDSNREADAISPCLSLCSGDSGKGSSLPRPEAVAGIIRTSVAENAASTARNSSVAGEKGAALKRDCETAKGLGVSDITSADDALSQPCTSKSALGCNADMSIGSLSGVSAMGVNTHEFYIPKYLVSYLVGKKRVFLNEIKQRANVFMKIRQISPESCVSICTIQGTSECIGLALALIRQRMPFKKYPELSLERIQTVQPNSSFPLTSESIVNLRLYLIERINNDVAVTTVISGGHLFVQHPLHPSYPSLAIMQKCLYDSYNEMEAPLLPTHDLNTVCVLKLKNDCYRVQIVRNDLSDDDTHCIVKLLDFGGYVNVHRDDLRQIRSDFMTLPFQATECVLSDVEPIDSCWTSEAAQTLTRLTSGIILQAQIVGYNDDNVPEVYLYANIGPNNVIFINMELVARNLAKWVGPLN